MSFLHFCIPIPCLCSLDCRFSCLLLALLDFPTLSFCPGSLFPRFHWAARRYACFNASMAMAALSFFSISKPSVSWLTSRFVGWHWTNPIQCWQDSPCTFLSKDVAPCPRAPGGARLLPSMSLQLQSKWCNQANKRTSHSLQRWEPNHTTCARTRNPNKPNLPIRNHRGVSARKGCVCDPSGGGAIRCICSEGVWVQGPPMMVCPIGPWTVPSRIPRTRSPSRRRKKKKEDEKIESAGFPNKKIAGWSRSVLGVGEHNNYNWTQLQPQLDTTAGPRGHSRKWTSTDRSVEQGSGSRG